MSDILNKNISRIFFFKFTVAFMVIMPIMIPFFKTRGLNMEQIYQLQSVFAVFMLIFEVPSGYISDIIGRKKTLILGSIFHFLGFMFFPLSTGFLTLVIAEIFLAFAVSLISGTDISILYDSLDAVNSKKSRIKYTGRFFFYQQMGEAIAGLLGGWIALISINTTAFAQLFVGIFPLFIALSLTEPPRNKMNPKKHKDNLLFIYKKLFKHAKLLTLILLNGIVLNSATLIAVWSFQDYWQKINIDIYYFGYLWAFMNLFVAVVARYAHKIEKKISSVGAVVLMSILPFLAFLFMAQVNNWLGAFICLFFQLSRGLNSVILKDALNKRVPTEIRATANSIQGLGVRMVFIFLGPLMGYLIDLKGYDYAYNSFGGLYAILFVLVTIPFLFRYQEFSMQAGVTEVKKP